MDRFHLENPGTLKPNEETDEIKLVAKTGDQHEADYLASLKKEGKDVVEIARNDPEAEVKTIAAMKQGHEIIFQGCIALAPFRGYTDFLVRDHTAGDDKLCYEIWDTKLARKPKPYYLVQLCCYAEMLEALLGERPRKVRVVLGNLEIPAFNTSEFFHYYLQLKEAFLEQMEIFDPAKPPEPQPRADHGRWASHADALLREADHLVRVANISVGQIKKLQSAGVTTVNKLADLKGHAIKELPADTLAVLVEQAQLQLATETKRKAAKPGELVPAVYRVLPAAAAPSRRGLATLPPPSPNDVYFDMEGYPLVDQGLEYLFGAVYLEAGKMQFVDWWAHDAQGEKVAFEQFVDWAYKRWKAEPAMHIYHYAAYEVSALRRLMGRYGSREEQVDDLLRGNVFVDLYQVVRQGLRVGEESYSIKYIEHLYRPMRQGTVATAGQSIVEYARWIESGEPRDWRNSPRLEGIRKYNCDDCESIVQLADWLRKEQAKAGIKYLLPAGPRSETKADPVKDAEKQAAFAELQRLIQSLDQKAQAEKLAENKVVHIMCRDLVGFHRREEKPVWWRMFDRAALTHQELKEDIACIGEASLVSEAGKKIKLSMAFDYTFDPNQDIKLSEGTDVMPVDNLEVKFEILSLTEDGALQVKAGGPTLKKLDGKMPALTSFLPVEVISSESLRTALHDVIIEWERDAKISPALAQLLRRQPPDIAGVKSETPLQNPGEDVVQAAVRLVTGMTTSTLCLQGPPGTGKTYTASCMIKALLEQGKKVGVTSNSHKAIINLLRSCNDRMTACPEHGCRLIDRCHKCGERRPKVSLTAPIGRCANERCRAWLFEGKAECASSSELDYAHSIRSVLALGPTTLRALPVGIVKSRFLKLCAENGVKKPVEIRRAFSLSRAGVHDIESKSAPPSLSRAVSMARCFGLELAPFLMGERGNLRRFDLSARCKRAARSEAELDEVVAEIAAIDDPSVCWRDCMIKYRLSGRLRKDDLEPHRLRIVAANREWRRRRHDEACRSMARRIVAASEQVKRDGKRPTTRNIEKYCITSWMKSGLVRKFISELKSDSSNEAGRDAAQAQ